MKALFAALALVSTASVAQADGFRCQTVEGDLNVQVYNQTDAQLGTREAAVMVLSNALVKEGRKTIAVFHAEDELVAQKGAVYTSKVDLRYKESSRKGELIGATKLGHLAFVVVAVDFSYASPMAAGEATPGTITFVKRNGEESFQELVCVRYLKGSM